MEVPHITASNLTVSYRTVSVVARIDPGLAVSVNQIHDWAAGVVEASEGVIIGRPYVRMDHGRPIEVIFSTDTTYDTDARSYIPLDGDAQAVLQKLFAGATVDESTW